MKKIAILIVASLFILPLVVFAQGQDIEVAPKVLSVEGGSAATFEPGRWPDFYQYIPADGCKILDNFSKRRLLPQVGGIMQYVIDLDEDGNEVYSYTPNNRDYVTSVPGLRLSADFTGDWAEYRNTARILITWTVRLEGAPFVRQTNRQHTPNWFGQACSGTSRQAFPKGEAYTKLFVNGSAIGSSAIMTIPYGGTGSVTGKVDPTHTGSVVLTPDMFGGSFPENLEFEIKIYNDTSMQLTSPKDMRNLIATMTPIN